MNNYYEEEKARAYKAFLSWLRQGNDIVTAIGKVRGAYSDALANSIKEQISKEILKREGSDWEAKLDSRIDWAYRSARSLVETAQLNRYTESEMETMLADLKLRFEGIKKIY